MKYAYLPEPEKSFDFIILGSKPGFAAMLVAAAVLVIAAIYVISKAIKRGGKK